MEEVLCENALEYDLQESIGRIVCPLCKHGSSVISSEPIGEVFVLKVECENPSCERSHQRIKYLAHEGQIIGRMSQN